MKLSKLLVPVLATLSGSKALSSSGVNRVSPSQPKLSLPTERPNCVQKEATLNLDDHLFNNYYPEHLYIEPGTGCDSGVCRIKTKPECITELLGRLNKNDLKEQKELLGHISTAITLLDKDEYEKASITKEFIDQSNAILEKSDEDVKETTEYKDFLGNFGKIHNLPKINRLTD